MSDNENLIPSLEQLKEWFANNPNEIPLVRTCKIKYNKLISSYDFEWPARLFTEVTAPDWNSDPVCGEGLHGLVPGQQDPGIWWDGAWLLVSADRNTLVNLEGNSKSKAPHMTILAIAYNNGATIIPQLLRQLGYTQPVYKAVIVDTENKTNISVGNNGIVEVGNYSYATAGHSGTAKAGDCSIATAGNFGQATVGNGSKATAGSQGRALAGSRSEAIAGYMGIAIAGPCGRAKTEKLGTSIADWGGRAAAGEGGVIQVKYITDDFYAYHIGHIGKTLDINGNQLVPDQYYEVQLINDVPQWVAT